MKTERSAGSIIYRKEKDNIYYLLLRYQSQAKKAVDYWGFPKGHIEAGEREKQTVLREVKEETGIKNLKFKKGFRYVLGYKFRKEGHVVEKTVSFFLAETDKKTIRVSFEHVGYQWINYKQALKELLFENDKKMLKAANKFILSQK